MMDFPSRDRLSELPLELFILLISYLPFVDAFRLCSLRKDWYNQSLWFYSSRIELDELDFMYTSFRQQLIGEGKNAQSLELKCSGKAQFVHFLDRITQCLLSPILSTFYLSMSYMPIYHGNIDKWIEFALSKSVEKLSLDFSDNDLIEYPLPSEAESLQNYILPKHFYDRGITVRFLTLSFCCLGEFNLKNFVNLRTLNLCQVAIQNWKILNVLSHCQMLEILRLIECCALIDVEICLASCGLKRLIINDCGPISLGVCISLPNLEYFEYVGQLVWFKLRQMPKLKEVVLDFPSENPFPYSASAMKRYLKGITKTKILTLCSSALQVLPSEFLIGKHIFPQSKMEHLNLKAVLGRNEVPGILNLLRSCPRLESISIFLSLPRDDDNNRGYPELPSNIWRSRGRAFPRLEWVDIEGFTGHRYEVELLKFILETSRRLMKVNITVEETVDVPFQLESSVTEQLRTVTWASSSVVMEWN